MTRNGGSTDSSASKSEALRSHRSRQGRRTHDRGAKHAVEVLTGLQAQSLRLGLRVLLALQRRWTLKVGVLGGAGTLLLLLAVFLVAKVLFLFVEAALRGAFLVGATMLRKVVGTGEGFAAVGADVGPFLGVSADVSVRESACDDN